MYLDALARSEMNEFARFGREAVTIGVRAAQGHAHGLERFYEFINYGPPGPDGKKGTADDLKNPFIKLGLKPADFAERRSPADLADEDVKVLRQARAVLRDLGANEAGEAGLRRDSLAALVRVQLALGDWADGPEWYLEHFQRHPKDAWYVRAWLSAGQLAGKAAAPHLAGARDFWLKYDALDAYAGAKEPDTIGHVRKELERAESQLRKVRPVAPKHAKTWKLTLQRIDLRRLKPYPEDPKKR